ncbi:MAG: hypothetical protein ABSA64_04585 [Sedimentisphaerales bacterium]
MDEFLAKLAERLQIPDADTVSADEIEDWPQGKLKELVTAGILTEIPHAKGVICDQCGESHYIEPDIRKCPDGKAVGVYICPDVGRIEVDLNRLKQWQIDKKKLWKMVYGFDSEWQLPWTDDNGEYVTLQEAVNLASDDSITVKNMSRLLKDPEFPVHRMHKGQRCKVHLGEFRKWLKFALHGQVTDKAIEKYLEGAEKRKELAHQKKITQKSRRKP